MKRLNLIRKSLAITLTVCLILPGSAMGIGRKGKKNFSEGVKYSAQLQWDLAAQEFALAVAADPDNAEYRAHYIRSLLQSSLMFAKRGDALAEQNDYAGAFNAYRQSFAYDPTNEVSRVKMQRMIDSQKAAAGVGEPTAYNRRTGNIQNTSNEVRTAYKPRYGEIQKKIEIKDLSLKSSVASIGRTLGLNTIFDESVREVRFSIDLQDVTFARALDLIFLQNKLTYELVDRKTIFVYMDNPTNKQRFERFMLKTFYLANAKHADVRTALQALLGTAGGGRIFSSIDALNAILVRATPAELQMVQEVINNIDKNRAEVVIDVNIYEISRTDALQLGNQVALTPQQVTETKFDSDGQPVQVVTGQAASLAGLGGIGQLGVTALAGTVFSPFLGGIGTLFGLPPTGVSLLQAKGRSRLLYNSQVHALDGQQNQTKLGQSVPVSTGTNYGYGGYGTPGTQGQTQGGQQVAQPGNFANSGLFDNIQYKDVGLVIDVTPTITNEGYVEIKMKLESSSVEESGETASLTPTFAQRSLSTTARVLDGVTAVVGGVKQDQNGESRATIPFIGMVPILGRFFSAPRNANRETDLVITVTPHIIRSPEIKQEDHLAQLAGQMQGGLSRSLEDVLQSVKEDEEQERRLIAKQSGQPVTTPTAGLQAPTTIGAGVAVNNAVANTAANTAPPQAQPPPVVPVPQPSAESTAPARIVDASFRPDQPAAEPGAGQSAEKPQEGQEKAKKPESEKSEAEKADEKLQKELEQLQASIEKPPAGVAPAKVVAPEIPDYVRERLEKIRAEDLKKAKEQKPEATPQIPEEYRNIRGPQQPVGKAVVKPANRGASPGTPQTIPISTSLKSTGVVSVGKSHFVELVVKGDTALAAGGFTLNFDATKLQVKSVRPARAAGSLADVIHEVNGGTLRVTISAIDQKQLTAGESLAIIEFIPVQDGSAVIEFKNDEAKLRLPNSANAQVSGEPLKLQIVK